MQKFIWQFSLGVLFAIGLVITLIVFLLPSGRSSTLLLAVAIFAGGLILVAVLPRLTEFSIGPKGVAGRISQLETEVDKAKERIAEQQKAINTLVSYNMSASIFRHLCGIVLLKEYKLEFQETNKRELYFLRDHGFIQPRRGGFLDFSGGGANIAEMAAPTPIAYDYVKLRKQEIPPEMLSDLKNIRLDVNIADFN